MQHYIGFGLIAVSAISCAIASKLWMSRKYDSDVAASAVMTFSVGSFLLGGIVTVLSVVDHLTAGGL